MRRLIEQCVRFLFVFLAFCILSFAAIIYSGSADRWLTENVSTSLTEAAGIPVEVYNAHIEFPLKISADSVVIGSSESPLFKLEQLNIDWNAHELLRGKLVISQLDIDTLTVYALPEQTASGSASESKEVWIHGWNIQNFQFSKELQTSFDPKVQQIAAFPWQLQGSSQISKNGFIKAAFHIQNTDALLSADGTLYGTFDNLDINTNFKASSIEASDISINHLQGSAQLKTASDKYIGNLKASASVYETQVNVSGDFNYDSTKLNLTQISLQTPYGEAKGDLLFSLDEKWIEGTIQADATLNTDIKGNASLILHFNRDPSSPLTISLKSPLLEIPDISLNDITIDATLAGFSNSSSFTAQTSVKKVLSPKIPFQGEISGHGSFEGLLSAPTGQLEFNVSNLISSDERWAHTPAAHGQVRLLFAKNLLSFQGQLASSAIPSCQISGSLPLIFSLAPPQLIIDRQQEIAGHFDVQGNLETVLQLFFPDFTMLSGTMAASGGISGSLDTPQYRAVMEIKNSIFEVAASGTVLKDLHATLETDGKSVTLKTLQATDGAHGKIIGHGGMTINNSENHPFALDFDIENSTLWQQDYTSATFTGQLTFSGDTQHGKLAGTATCTSAEIIIPDHTDALIDTVEVIYINQPKGVIPPPTLSVPAAWPFAFDIAIQVPSTLSIVGQELDSIWKGKLTIAGNTDLPLLFGDFHVVEGYYMFNGKNFLLEQGLVSIAGEVDKKTTLYVIAAKDLGKVKVEVIMKGSVKNPEISFRSNPPMSQREILSWILFNRGTSEISHFQGSQLRESITNLSNSSTHKGPDVLTKIRNAIGIDRIEICKGEGDSSTMGVQVGKYISQNVFVSVNKSDVNRLAVEAALTENIKLEADIGDNEEGNLMLKWKRDY